MVNDPLYNHTVFGPEKGKGGNYGKSDEQLLSELINIHNTDKWLGIDGDMESDPLYLKGKLIYYFITVNLSKI